MPDHLPSRSLRSALPFLLALAACHPPATDLARGSHDAPGGSAGGDAGAGGAPARGDGGDGGAGTGGATAGSGGAGDVTAGAGGSEGGAGGSGGTTACDPAWPGAQWGTELDDEVLALAATPTGLLVAGYDHGRDGITNIEPAGDADGFVVSLDTAGAERWRHDVGGAAAQTVEAILPEPGGNTLFTGRTGDPEGPVDGIAGRLDAAGGVLGFVTWGGPGPEHPRSIARAGDRVVVSGFDDVFVEGNHVADWEHGFVVALDDTLQNTWSKRVTATSELPGLAADDTGLFVMGMASSRQARGVFVQRLVPDGSGVLWATQLTGASLDSAMGLTFAPDGDLLAAGTTIADLSGAHIPNSHGFLARLDRETGAVRWVREFGSGGGDYLSALATGPDGHVWIAGVTLGTVLPDRPNAGSIDAFVFELDGEGDVVRAFQTGTPSDDWARAIAVDGCGRAYLAGSTGGALFEDAAQGGRDAFVMLVPR